MDAELIRRRSTKFLSYDYPATAKQRLQDLADYADAGLEPDDYGKGELADRLSARVAALLGKPRAIVVPTGRMAQLIALKLWCDRRGTPSVAMHPRCHLEEYESKAYQHVFGLKAVAAGGYNRITGIADLQAIREPLGVLHLEVPQLSAGCRAPEWRELVAMSAWARERRIPVHLDGARLWECQPFYQRSHAEICALFDTVYTSFYKGLSAMAGAVLAGPEDFIEDAVLWQHRMGGHPARIFPLLLDAERMLDRSLPLMETFFTKARRLAEALSRIPGVWTTPNPPHTNTFLVTVAGDPARLRPAAAAASAETGLWLVDFTRDTGIDGLAQFQVVVGTATLDVTEEEAVRTLARTVELMQ